MLSRPVIAIAVWLGAIPALAILALLAGGLVHPRLAIMALIGTVVWSGGAGLILARDLAAFRRSVEEASLDQLRLITPGLSPLALSAIRTIVAERDKLSRLTTVAAANQALLDRLPDALFRLDHEGGTQRVVWQNPSAERAYGADAQALLRHPGLRTAIAQAETAERPVRASINLAAPIPRDLDAVLIRAADGPSAPLFMLLIDRTRERGLDQMRQDFVANASHELRTPLTSLIGFIETLRGPAAGDAEAGQQFLGIMAEQADRMQRIIADLLSLSRIEMMEHQPPEQRVAIAQVVQEVAGFMAPLLAQQETRLDLHMPETLPDLRGDAGQLTQIFTNLLDNAIKYGKRGGVVKIQTTLTPTELFPLPGILVEVIDDGPGIARDHIPRLTERFYRVDKGRSRTVGGTGLGLAIVKHAVSRHRGRFVIESTENIGTRCGVWLPLAPEAEKALSQTQMTVARKG